jgi:hypothetical protein
MKIAERFIRWVEEDPERALGRFVQVVFFFGIAFGALIIWLLTKIA